MDCNKLSLNVDESIFVFVFGFRNLPKSQIKIHNYKCYEKHLYLVLAQKLSDWACSKCFWTRPPLQSPIQTDRQTSPFHKCLYHWSYFNLKQFLWNNNFNPIIRNHEIIRTMLVTVPVNPCALLNWYHYQYLTILLYQFSIHLLINHLLFQGHDTDSSQGAAKYRPTFLDHFEKKAEIKVLLR